jgi:hypothetical protein
MQAPSKILFYTIKNSLLTIKNSFLSLQLVEFESEKSPENKENKENITRA